MKRFGTKHQWTLYFFILRFAAVSGALVGAFVGPAFLAPSWYGAIVVAMVVAIDLTVNAILIGGVEVFFFRTRLGRALDRAPFLAIYAIKLFAYGAIVLCVGAVRVGSKIVDQLINNPHFVGSDLWRAISPHLKAPLIPIQLTVANGLLILVLVILLLQLSRLVGERSFRDIALGRYHRPRTEERFFLFIDIVGSTSLAERIGPIAVHRFLDRVFQVASDPIDDYEGEVYQYVGDEIVITWTVSEGGADARPLACYFAIGQALTAAAEDFQGEFDTVPQLRAALHAGSVVSGEVGGSRRAIVFHGDVMNTTSRIENATRDLQRPFLVSEDALNRLECKEAYNLADLGPQPLRGRSAPLRLYAVALGSDQPVLHAQQ